MRCAGQLKFQTPAPIEGGALRPGATTAFPVLLAGCTGVLKTRPDAFRTLTDLGTLKDDGWAPMFGTTEEPHASAHRDALTRAGWQHVASVHDGFDLIWALRWRHV